MKETGALLAGEMSGHVFFKERWYGFDDGLYAGARLLEYLSRQADINATLHSLPDTVNTPELQIKMEEGEHYALIETAAEDAPSFPAPGSHHASTACAWSIPTASAWRGPPTPRR